MQLLLWQYQFSGGRAGFRGHIRVSQPGLALSCSALPTTIVFVFENLLAARLSEIRLLFARVGSWLSMMLLISSLLVFCLSIALADLSHRLVTAPSGNLGHRLTRARRASRIEPPPVLSEGRI